MSRGILSVFRSGGKQPFPSVSSPEFPSYPLVLFPVLTLYLPLISLCCPLHLSSLLHFTQSLTLQAFAIFITHTSFRLYHAFFPKTYLQSLHDTGFVHQEIQLSASKLFDVCDPDERGQWLDVLIAMVEYLRSGESKVGCLNNSMEKNMLHKDNEVQFEKSVAGDQRSGQIREREYAGYG